MAKSKKQKAAAAETTAPAIEPAATAVAQPPVQPAGKLKSAKGGKTAPAAEAPKPAAPPMPSIDTNLAAAAAANMLVHRDQLAPVTAKPQGDATRPESSAFKQLKQGLNKPGGNVGNLLGLPAGHKKSALPFAGGKQNFRNQTFGADVNRTGVPRRTGG